MSDTGPSRGFNAPLLIVLAVVGLLLMALWSRGCLYYTTGLDLWSWSRPWGFGLFGPHSGPLALWLVLSIVLGVWVGTDANRRGMNGGLWALLVIFTSVVGLIVYLIASQDRRNGAEARAEPAAEPAGAACRSCGTAVRPEFKVCPHCGTELAAGCRECGRPQEPAWKVCPYCGTRRDGPPEETS